MQGPSAVFMLSFLQFVGSRDSCERTEQKPVYEIPTGAGKLWPLVVVEQVCCKTCHFITNIS